MLFNKIRLSNLTDYFIPLNERAGVYFYRFNSYDHDFLLEYFSQASKVIDGKMSNPTTDNIDYLRGILGEYFKSDIAFLSEKIHLLMPRLSSDKVSLVSEAMFEVFKLQLASGKNESVLSNTYLKFMYWLYFRFEGVLSSNTPQRLLYSGSISYYELLMLHLLSLCGCDVVLLNAAGEDEYLKVDADSQFSYLYEKSDLNLIDSTFSLSSIKNEVLSRNRLKNVYGTPTLKSYTNLWIDGDSIDDVRQDFSSRVEDKSLVPNLFIAVNGVFDRTKYLGDLFKLKTDLVNKGRKLEIIDNKISSVAPNEIASIHRKLYSSKLDLAMSLAENLSFADKGLTNYFRFEFVNFILSCDDLKLEERAVRLVCLIRRYSSVDCLILFDIELSDLDKDFLNLISKLPKDILIFNPNKRDQGLQDLKSLYQLNYKDILDVNKFPESLSYSTVAYCAERDLDTVLYKDSGIYRDKQFKNATSVILRTMYEEISLLWNEGLNMRVGFSTDDNSVVLPVIFAKINGVKDGNERIYRESIKTLVSKNTIFAVDKDICPPYKQNQNIEHSRSLFGVNYWSEVYDFSGLATNDKLNFDVIKSSKYYKLGFLSSDLQDYLLSKLQILENSGVLKCSLSTILYVFFSLTDEIIRLIQGFDFTKINPKMVYLITKERMISTEDTVLLSYLNLVGFDIVIFTPTGYDVLGSSLNKKLYTEHTIGECVFDLNTKSLSVKKLFSRR